MLPPAAPLLGRTLAGRYQILRLIGAGGMGAVYEAIQTDLGRRVAVKVLLEAEPRAVERFRQEALASASLSGPNIVTVFDFVVEPPEPPFLVMELLQGESLATLLRRERSLPVERAVAITRQILRGLATAHRAGIVHRDIKPSNIWLVPSDGGEEIKVLDFGIAKLLAGDGVHTTTGAIVGTAGYLAPEQIRGEAVDPRADLFAVGVCFFQMLTGERPWGNRTGADVVVAILTEPAPPLATMLPGAPRELAASVDRALAMDRDARWESAVAMSSALGQVRAAPALEPRVEAPTPPRRRAVRTFTISLLLTVVVALGVGATLAVRARRPSDTTQATMVDAASPSTTTSPAADPNVEEPLDPTTDDDASTLDHASTAVDASALTARPAKQLPPLHQECECITYVNQRRTYLCTTPLEPKCECTRTPKNPAGQNALCPVAWTLPDGWNRRCPAGLDRYSGVGKKNGDACTGHLESTNMWANGTLESCTSCYEYPRGPGRPNMPCRGYHKQNVYDGHWLCTD